MAATLDTALAALGPAGPGPTRFARGHRGDPDGAGPGGLADDVAADHPSARHPLATGTSGVFPPLHLSMPEPGTLVGATTFGPAWEGPPGLVHGGFLAATFDIVLSALAHHVLGTSVTRSLRVRYLKPTFLAVPLRFEVTAEEPEGRLLDLRATLYAHDRVTMRATAQFATLDAARFAARGPAAGDPATPG